MAASTPSSRRSIGASTRCRPATAWLVGADRAARRSDAGRLRRRHRVRHERVPQDADRVHSGCRRRLSHHGHAAAAGLVACTHERSQPARGGAGAADTRRGACREHRRLLGRDAHQRVERGCGVRRAEAVRRTRAAIPNLSAQAIQKALLAKFSTIQDAMVLVVAPPPVRGIGSCRRLPHDDPGSGRGGIGRRCSRRSAR